MKRLLGIIVVIAIVAGSAWALGSSSENTLAQAVESGDILRLHVVANSDAKADQEIKLKVRDAALASARDAVGDAHDAMSARKAIENHLSSIEAAAREEARAQGFSGAVTATVGRYEFPDKVYGGVLVPEGTYDALRISLGEGKGANWWCVIYPSLCFEQEGAASITAMPSDIKLESSIVKWFKNLFKKPA